MLSKRVFAKLTLLLCLLVSEASRAESLCAIVYGKNWAFLFAAPKQWQVNCPVDDQSGMVVTLWPEGTSWAKAPSVMYVTVSQKNGFSLNQFVEDELTRFRVQSPKLQVEVIQPISLKDKSLALVRKLTGDQYRSHELVAYADTGSAYLIVVFSSRSQNDFKRLSSAFNDFVLSISPMKIEFSDVEKSKVSAPEGSRETEPQRHSP